MTMSTTNPYESLIRKAQPTDQQVEEARSLAFKRGHRAAPSVKVTELKGNRMLHEKTLGRFFASGMEAGPALARFGLGGPPTDPATIKKFGMGACDTTTAMARALQAVTAFGFSAQPVIEYVRQTITVPQLDSSVAASFGDSVDLFNPTTPPGAIESSSFLGNNGTLQVDMFAAGLGLHLYAGPVSFAIPGNAVLTSIATPIWSPDVWTLNDLLNGGLGSTANVLGSVVPASLDYGGVVHELLWHMSQAYRVRLYMNQKFIVLDEPLSDFAYFTSYGAAEMAGTSERAIQPYVKEVNGNYRSLGATYIFEPINARRIGSTTIAGATATNQGSFHPTRDFDFADVTYGGMAFAQGNCCKPYHPFQCPTLFDRGITISLLLERVDQYNWAQMQRLMSISQGVGGTNALVQMDATVNGYTNGGAAGVLPAGRELLLDQGANAYSTQSVDTDRMEFEGGVFEMFAGIKGQEFWGDWRDQLKCAAKAGQIQAPTLTGNWYGQAVG